MDSIREQMDLTNEISEAISNPVGMGNMVDEVSFCLPINDDRGPADRTGRAQGGARSSGAGRIGRQTAGCGPGTDAHARIASGADEWSFPYVYQLRSEYPPSGYDMTGCS